MSDGAPPARPLPLPDEASQPWFDAAREGRLLLQRCDACGTHRFPLWPRCNACWETHWSWAEASGRGTLFSWGRMHRVYDPGMRDEVPYLIAIVQLEEGPRLQTRLLEPKPSAPPLRCDMAVDVAFEAFGGDVPIPVFRLA